MGPEAEEVFGGMTGGVSGRTPDEPGADAVAGMRAELARAEAEEADARAEAAQARVRAAEPETADATPDDDALPGYEADLADDPLPAAAPPVARGRFLAQTAALALAALLTGAALTLTVLMLWQHAKVSAQRTQERRFVDAARDGVVALLSMDYTHARADVQRVLDLSAGPFHDQFSSSADDFVKTAEASKAVTTGTVSVAALDELDGDRGQVLVAAVSEVSNANGAKQDRRPFRMMVTVTREGDTCKMSDVEFVA